MESINAQNEENQRTNIANGCHNNLSKRINIKEKMGDFCFDTVKYIFTVSLISTIFIELNSIYLVFVIGLLFIAILSALGLWLYKNN